MACQRDEEIGGIGCWTAALLQDVLRERLIVNSGQCHVCDSADPNVVWSGTRHLPHGPRAITGDLTKLASTLSLQSVQDATLISARNCAPKCRAEPRIRTLAIGNSMVDLVLMNDGALGGVCLRDLDIEWSHMFTGTGCARNRLLISCSCLFQQIPTDSSPTGESVSRTPMSVW